MWKWYILWLAALTGLMYLVISRGVPPKPITKIRLSQFDSIDSLVAATQKRLHFEIKSAQKIEIGSFELRPWMSEFAETFRVNHKHKGSIRFVESFPPQFPLKSEIFKIFLVDIRDVGQQPESCARLTGRKLVDCHSNGFLWRLRKKKNANLKAKYLAQVEQLARGAYAIYIKKSAAN